MIKKLFLIGGGVLILLIAGAGLYVYTAVDMSAVLLEQNRKNLAAAGLEKQVRLLKADARDLSAVGGEEILSPSAHGAALSPGAGGRSQKGLKRSL